MITDKEIEEVANQHESDCFRMEPYIESTNSKSFIAGAKWARDKMLERASDRFVSGAGWSMDELAKAEKRIKELEARISQLLTDSDGEFRSMSAYQRLKAKNEKYRKVLENLRQIHKWDKDISEMIREALKEGGE